MSNSKPARRREMIDLVKDLKKNNRKNNGLGRQNFSGLASADFGSVTSSSSGGAASTSGGSPNTVGLLKTSGDVMMGPISFSTKTKTLAAGVIDISKDTGTGYSSYVIASCAAGINDLNTITGAEHDGQLLFLDAPATVTVRLKHNTGNIFIADAADFDLVPSSVGILIYDFTITKWQLVSAFVRDSGGAASWVGSATSDLDMNTYDIYDVDRLKFATTEGAGTALLTTDYGLEAIYSGGTAYGMKLQFPSGASNIFQIFRGSSEIINISSVGTQINNNVYLGDSTADSVNITGTLNCNHNVVLGNSGTDTITFTGKAASDINMSTYDIYGVDRLKFSTTDGSGSSLISTDTGIEAIYSGGSPFGLKVQFPSTNSAILGIYRGVTNTFTMSAIGSQFNTALYVGATSSHHLHLAGVLKAQSGTPIGVYVDNSSTTVGTKGTMGLPYFASTDLTPSDATLDGWYGNRNGNMGIHYYSTGGTYRIYMRANGTWQRAFAT